MTRPARPLTLGIVNRHRDDAVTTSIEIGGGAPIGSAVAYEVNGDDPTVLNSFDRPDAVTVQERTLSANGASLEADAAGPLGDRRPPSG